MNHITRQIKDITSLSSRFNYGVLSVDPHCILKTYLYQYSVAMQIVCGQLVVAFGEYDYIFIPALSYQ